MLFEALHITRRLQDPLEQIQKRGRVGGLLTQGPELDPLSEQTSYAPALLDLFKWVLQSPGYVQRLKKHYQLFRAAVDEEFAKKNPPLPYPEGQCRTK